MRKLNRKRKLKRGKANLNCGYCQAYREASVRRGGKKESSPHERLCRTKYVRSDSKACESFTSVRSFWCDRNQYWLSLKDCVNRRNTIDKFDRHKLCLRCDQAKEIDAALKAENNDQPRRVLKRRGAK